MFTKPYIRHNFPPMAQQPQLPYASSLLPFRDHNQSDATQSVRLPWTSDRYVAKNSDNTQQSQETNIHAPGEIRTLNPSKRVAVEPRLTQRGYRDRLTSGNKQTKLQSDSLVRWTNETPHTQFYRYIKTTVTVTSISTLPYVHKGKRTRFM